MGWNSWNTFGGSINEQVVRDTADAIVEKGLKDAGYECGVGIENYNDIKEGDVIEAFAMVEVERK